MTQPREVDPPELDPFEIHMDMVRKGVRPIPKDQAEDLTARLLRPITKTATINVHRRPSLTHLALFVTHQKIAKDIEREPSPFFLAIEATAGFAEIALGNYLAGATAKGDQEEIKVFVQAIAGIRMLARDSTDAENSLAHPVDTADLEVRFDDVERTLGFEPEPEKQEERVRHRKDQITAYEDRLVTDGPLELLAAIVGHYEETPSEHFTPFNKEFILEGMRLAAGLFDVFYEEAINGKYKEAYTRLDQP